MNIPIDTTVLTWREVDGEVVIVDERTSVYFGLNASATPLWRRLVAGATRDDLVRILVDGGASPRQSAEHVDGFLDGLRAEGLIGRESEDPPTPR